MGTFREQEGSSGLEDLDVSRLWNTMHGFWLRFAITAATTTVWVISWIRVSMYGVTMSMLWVIGAFIVLSAIGWFSTGRQLYLDTLYHGGFNSSSDEYSLGKDLPW